MTFNADNLRVTEGHKALAAYIKRETGKQVKAESVALVLALQTEFRKDPARVAEREAVKAAADERRRAALEKHLAKARALAAALGQTLDAPEVAEQEHGTEEMVIPGKAVELAPAAPEEPEEEMAEVIPIRTVENDFGGDVSAIDVVESSDGWESPDSALTDDDF